VSGLTAVSLFAGIEGFGLALERSGITVKAAVEIDPACRGILRRHFPRTALFSDVTKVTAREILAAGFVPRRGILAGGWPCQDLSIAGLRAGLGGARSGLFWHFMRLADELRPQWILAENVPGLLSAVCPCPGSGACVANRRAVRCGEWRAERVPGGPDLGPVCPGCEHDWDVHDAGGFCATCSDTCEGLSEAKVRKVWYPGVPHAVRGGACPGGCMPAHGGAMGTVLGALGHRGYGFAYRVLDAQFFGVPQHRRRVFIAGCLGDAAGPVEVLLEPEGGDGHPAQGRETGQGPAARAGDGAVATLQGGGRRGHRIDAEGAAGGHLVPMAFNPQTGGSKARLGYGEIPTALQASQVTAVHVAATLSAGTATGEGVRPPGRRLEDDVNLVAVTALGGEGVVHALTSEGADASEDGTGRGTPIVAYALTSRNDRNDREENWVTAPIVPDVAGISENQRGEVLETPYSRQLTTGGGKPGQGYGAVREGTAVRRLTPRECERLQGFPDDWTRWLDDGTEQSDSARYRQAGNAVAVCVAEWIARRVVAVDSARDAGAEGAA
jgi:DNA (cytosine-5)-methyltransferase 1